MSSLKLERTFPVAATPETVWRCLLDPSMVVTCLPGASLDESSADGRRHEGAVTVKLGAMSVSYRGSADFVEVDDETRRMRVEAKGRERAGAGSAKMSVTVEVLPAEEGCEVCFKADIGVTGKIVAFGRGMIEVVTEEVFDDFSTRLCSKLAEGNGGVEDEAGTAGRGDVQPADGLAILVRALRSWLARLFGRR